MAFSTRERRAQTKRSIDRRREVLEAPLDAFLRQRKAQRAIDAELAGKASQQEVDAKASVSQVQGAISAAIDGLDTVADRAAAVEAVQAQIPPFAATPPLAEATSPAAGTMGKVPHADHQHPRLTATASGTLRTNNGADTGAGALVPGDAVITFTRTFSAKPAVTVLAIDDNTNNPVPRFKVKRWLRPDGQVWSSGFAYGGCVIYGERARPLPVIAPIGALALLSLLITALNTIIATLSGFTPYEPATGAAFTLIAVQPS